MMQIKERIQAAYTKLKIHRWIAWLLCAALMGGMISSALPALAVNDEREEGTLCEHHSEHTEECGYVEAVEGQPCTHEHDENCGYAEAVEGQLCKHEHDEHCGYAEGQPCTHGHDEECGYVEAVEGQECNHEHDEHCGYVEAVEGQPCGYVCEICGGGLEELPEEEIEQDVAAMADEPIAPRAVQEEGLIAHFKFDESTNRLYDSSGKNVKASLYNVTNGEPNLQGEITTNLDNYFSGGALYLQDNACLVLEETADFNNMTEMTVEMRIKINERGDANTSGVGTDANWLFYAEQPGVKADRMCLGVTLTTYRDLRILRQRDNDQSQFAEAEFPSFKYGEWYTVRIIYKPSNMALYVNDKRIVDKGLGNKTSDYFQEGRHLWFGHSGWNDTNFNGYIDDIKIYNYANYKKSNGGYLDGYIDEQKYILESLDPPNTTVHMFDYWITGQEDNDYNPPSSDLNLDGVLDGKINKGHLLLFAGGDATSGAEADYPDKVGSWNSYQYKDVVDGRNNHQSWEPFPGIVNNVLVDGYPQLAIEGLEKSGMFKKPNDGWYDRNADKADESLAYLFKPEDDVDNGKAAYPNVTGLFRLDEKGYYYFRCAKTFAELNRDQTTKPKRSTGNNRITLYQRSTEYKDFFPFNDATDLFYIKMDGKLDKANVKSNGSPDMNIQSKTDEPINHYFGMTVETTFEQTTDGKIDLPGGEKEDMNFHFSGDDDVWIFIDDVLVADVGGIHNEIDVNINFATGKVDFTGHDTTTVMGKTTVDNLDGTYEKGSGKIFDTTLKERFEKAKRYDESKRNPNNKELFADGSEHTLKFFYLERGNNVSRCTIEFNLQHVENDAEEHTHKKRSSSENVPVEPIFEEFVTLDVSTEELPKKKEETKEVGVLASPNTGDSNMVGLWFTLLMFSAAGLAAIHRTRKRGSK